MRLTPVDILANWYNDETLPWSAQKAVNCLAETAEVGGTRSVSKVKGLPGMLEIADLLSGAPIRGAEDVEGTLFVVSGTSLFQINTDFSFTNRGNIPGVSLVSMAHNKQGGTTAANELVIANGLSGYVYNTDTTALVQITDDAFPGASTFDYVDGYMSFTDPEGRFWGHSALNQATQYSSIDRYDAESAPDKIVSHIVSHREVMVFGTRTTEFFRNTGAATGTFQRVDGTEMEVGIAATLARARLDNTVYWLGNDGIVYRLAGHSPQRVSTRPIEQAIDRFNLVNAFAHTWEDRGHKVFYLTFPDGLTFGYDVATGLWHARETYGLDRWGINTTTRWNGLWVAGDYSNGKLYTMDWDTYHDAGQPLVMECQPGVTHADGNEVKCPYVELFMDTGKGSYPTLTLSGNIPDGFSGDAVSGAYTAAGGIAPYTFMVISGTLPTGVTLASNGTYSGTFTQSGSFSWVVEVTDSFSQTSTLDDSAQVTAVEWWITEAGTSSVWDTADITVPGPMKVRAPSNNTNRGAQQVGATVFFMGSTATWNKAPAAAYPGNIPTTNSAVAAVDNNVFTSGGIATVREAGTPGRYWITIDGGAIWQSIPDSGGLRTHLPYRLSSGRWIAYREFSSTFDLYFSDQVIPTIWTLGQHPTNSIVIPDIMATNGTVLCVPVGSTDPDGLLRTTDGDTYTTQVIPNVPAVQWTCGVAFGDHFIFSSAMGHTIASHDAGLTWATKTMIANLAVTRLEHANGVVVASGTNSVSGQPAIAFSTNNGDTWTGIARPAGAGAGSRLAAGPISYVP
jgi:hypothetical protein